MSNIFNFNRFRKYFIYDLSNAKNKFGLTMLICGMSPIIALVLTIFIDMFSMNVQIDTVSRMRIFALVVSYMVVVMSMPVKTYGSITEKRAGSTWLLVPASGFEKFLSVIIMVFVVAPICFCTSVFASDTLLGLIFPDIYGAPLMNGGFEQLKELGPFIIINGSKFEIAGSKYFNWCFDILFFTIGATFFKKSKTAKTILIFLIYVALVLTLGKIVSNGYICGIPMQDAESIDAQELVQKMKIVFNVVRIIIFGGLLGVLYFRLRTLKH